eukprot:scaffold19689_cov31-Tisochrysis_lutea.AAC.3
MARPVYVARYASQQDALQEYNFQRDVPPPTAETTRDYRDYFNLNLSLLSTLYTASHYKD